MKKFWWRVYENSTDKLVGSFASKKTANHFQLSYSKPTYIVKVAK